MEQKYNVEKWDGIYPPSWESNYITTFTTIKDICARMGCFVAGGAARSLITGETPTDIDLYHEDADAFDLTNTLGRLGRVEYKRNVPTYKITGVDVQLITFKTGDPQLVIKEFDFTCCQVATNGDWILGTEQAYADIKARKLRFSDYAIHEPVNLLARFWRIQKYLKKGYTLDAEEAFKYFQMEWSEDSKHAQERGINESSSHSIGNNPAVLRDAVMAFDYSSIPDMGQATPAPDGDFFSVDEYTPEGWVPMPIPVGNLYERADTTARTVALGYSVNRQATDEEVDHPF